MAAMQASASADRGGSCPAQTRDRAGHADIPGAGAGVCGPAKCRSTSWRRAFPRHTAAEVAPPPARAGEGNGGAEGRRKAGGEKKAFAEPETAESDRVANQSIRVAVDTLEHLMTMVSELVLTRNQLLEISRRHEDTEFKVPLQRLSQRPPAELQEGVMKTADAADRQCLAKNCRGSCATCPAKLGKQIELEMHGADTELDRQVLDLIKDPLTHMVRNSADHGLETAGRTPGRRQAGAGHHSSLRLS